mmetsp:Transcript_88903/g.198762  ORF Transcript_88903/g.198762 Transcript_88903/m.198762 type:complete len:144 (-) Transcript_88903:195-626(-)
MDRNASYSVRERVANRFEVDQRAALFDSRFKSGGSNKRSEDKYAAHSRDMMERQNDEQIVDLEAKVSELDVLARAIGKEAKDSNARLDDMGKDFDKAGSLLNSTLGHLKTMMQQKGSRHMCYMIVFVLVLLLFMYALKSLGGS